MGKIDRELLPRFPWSDGTLQTGKGGVQGIWWRSDGLFMHNLRDVSWLLTLASKRELLSWLYWTCVQFLLNYSLSQPLQFQIGLHLNSRWFLQDAFLILLNVPPNMECITVHHCSFIAGPAGSLDKLHYRRLRFPAPSIGRQSSGKLARKLDSLRHSQPTWHRLHASTCPMTAYR